MLETINGKSSTPFFQTASGISLPVPTGLPQTGMATKYVTGDDGDLQAGYKPPAARFTDHGDGTITDNATGLMWVKDMRLLGTLKGWWKLNTVYAVGDLVCGPATGFNYLDYNILEWSSGTNYVANIFAAWMDVDSPANSDEGWTGKARYFWRAIQNSGPSFGGAVNPSTEDPETKWGLVKAYRCVVPHTGSAPGGDPFGGERWERVKHIGAMRDSDGDFHERPVCWELAIQFCNEFEWAGYSDWRLPNVNEAISICDWKVGSLGKIFSEFTNQADTISLGKTWTSTRHYAPDSTAIDVNRTIDARPYPHAIATLNYLRPCRGGRING